MIAWAQDEVNLYQVKLTFLLQGKLILMDKNTTNMRRAQVLEEVDGPEGYIELNPNRQNKISVSDAIKLKQHFNVAAQQFGDAGFCTAHSGYYWRLRSIPRVGHDRPHSCVAISNLAGLGATTLSEINDYYLIGCQLVGQLARS
ncbi:hypothetical protein EHZ47_09495 [Aeromonas jandaei]|uniref:hypothetical protein n=1 Tax=Aeromonas jandaei TaxID=650 RepID=UPI000F54708B|nr:hypothetical protein [Aeromonas jandaei]RQM76276.1 hypothetical protein EHZ47_09495 [Aeromonas jandaei]